MKKTIQNIATAVIISCAVIHSGQCGAQSGYNSEEAITGSFNLGLGGSSLGSSLGLGFSIISSSNIFSMRFVHNEEIDLFSSSTPLYFWDFGILFGKVARSDLFMATIEGGISLVGYNERGEIVGYSGGWFGTTDYEMTEHQTIGIPIQSQLMITGKHIGVGVIPYLVLSSSDPVSGMMFAIKVGNLR